MTDREFSEVLDEVCGESCRACVQAVDGRWLTHGRELTDNRELVYVYPSLSAARAAGRLAGLHGFRVVPWPLA